MDDEQMGCRFLESVAGCAEEERQARCRQTAENSRVATPLVNNGNHAVS
ncbi:MAG: hypothetical protein SPI30_06090 [Prevotella sp.]|nr:hypothetical protein [Prevotella sp.]